jgi:hypothetical protein
MQYLLILYSSAVELRLNHRVPCLGAVRGLRVEPHEL